MSEKLTAFVTLYNEKAIADVENAKQDLVKAEERVTKAVELWNSIKAETDKLGITDKFTAAFPDPGGKIILTVGNSPNPNYLTLLQYGDPLESLVKDLTKLRSPNSRLSVAKNNLAIAQTLISRKPEEHLAILGSALVGALAQAAAIGANSTESLLKSVFSSYEGFEEAVMMEVDGVDAPSTINTSQQAYEALKEKFESGELFKKTETSAEEASPINEPNISTEPAPTSPLNPEVAVTPETETGVTNTSAVTGAPTQLPPETQAPPTGGGVTVNVETAPPVQTVPPETSPGASAINEIEIKAAQEKLSTGPAAELLKASGINLTSEKVSEILSNKETVQSQIQTIPTGTSPIGSTAESTNNVTETIQSVIFSEKSGASVINELEIKKSQEKLTSGPFADLLKASGINLTSEKISDLFSVKEKEATRTTTSSQTNQINQVDEKVKTSQIDSTLEATTTKQNISGETTNNENLGVTKDQMLMPAAPPPSEPSPSVGSSGVAQTPKGQTSPPETITGTEPTPNQGGETQAGPTQGTGPSSPAPGIGNLSELEARLARIEFLLSGPLEVKIIE